MHDNNISWVGTGKIDPNLVSVEQVQIDLSTPAQYRETTKKEAIEVN